jgi:hypothetical protein
MYKITVWYGSIKPEDRNMSTMSGPTSFNELDDALAYGSRVIRGGGEVVGDSIKEVDGRHGFQSIEEFDSMGRMTPDELSLLGKVMRKGR